MKLYDFTPAPNPRRVRIFLAEKGIKVPMEQIDLMSRAQLKPEFLAVNPQGTVPALVLDDGTVISEVVAICRYFEAVQPEPRLFGTTPAEQALVTMWEHIFELDGMLAIGEAFRNSVERFKDRALPGQLNHPQIPALVERGRRRTVHFFDKLEACLADRPYVAGGSYSIADITAMASVDFAKRMDYAIPEGNAHSRRWYEAVSSRPSAAA
jgi:glutathione S-transferase